MLFQRPESGDQEETWGLIHPDHFDFHRERHDQFDAADEKLYSIIVSRLDSLRQLSILSGIRFLAHYALSITAFFVPSFISKLLPGSGSRTTQTQKQLSPTAWLDGLRGVAALVVYIYHWTYLWFPVLQKGYGSPGAELFLQRPIVRALHSGRASVTVFFVISGYVLATKTVSAIHKEGQPGRVLDSLCGSLFRRPLRLYLPIAASTLAAALLARCGLFAADPTGVGEIHLEPGWAGQLRHWLRHTLVLANPFRAIDGRDRLYSPTYNGHLWTIPVEFKGSLVVFSLLLAFANCRRWLHLVVAAGCACWLVSTGDLDAALFVAGLLLAEVSLVFPPGGGRGDEALGEKKTGRDTPWTRHLATASLCLASLHLLSYPETAGPDSSGFRTISQLVPAFYAGNEYNIQWFWISAGAVLYITATMYSPPVSPPSLGARPWHGRRRQREATTTMPTTTEPGAATADAGAGPGAPRPQPLLQAPYTTRAAQYLGTVSYSLYLAHGSVVHVVGVRYLNPAWGAWGAAEAEAGALHRDGQLEAAAGVLRRGWGDYVAAYAWGTLVNTLVLFWVSDVFHRGVDAKVVRATRWAWEWAKRK